MTNKYPTSATAADDDAENAPLPMEIFLREIRHAYRSAYLDQAMYQQRSLASLRDNLELDVDYDPVEDQLYLWFEDPTLTTPEGNSYHGACLTSYPDVLIDVTASPPKEVLAWARMRAAAHCQYDGHILLYNSSALLKPKLTCGIRYVPPVPAAPAAAGSKSSHGKKDDEIF